MNPVRKLHYSIAVTSQQIGMNALKLAAQNFALTEAKIREIEKDLERKKERVPSRLGMMRTYITNTIETIATLDRHNALMEQLRSLGGLEEGVSQIEDLTKELDALRALMISKTTKSLQDIEAAVSDPGGAEGKDDEEDDDAPESLAKEVYTTESSAAAEPPQGG